MKLHQLLNAIYHEPALITPGAHASIRQLIESRLGQSAFATAEDAAQRKPGEGFCGSKVAVEQPYIDDQGIAHIPVGGALGQSLKPFERGDGAVDTLDIRNELAEYGDNPDVIGAIMDFDSPGGMVLGTPETADAIMEFRSRKPIYAYTQGMIASAAYWLAVATDGIYATRSANVGSIGTVITYHDLTGMAAQKGIKVEVIKSGKYKGMGTPGTALTAEQRDYLQERVDTITARFKAHVRAHRGNIPDDLMQGQMHFAPEASAAGLINGIVRSKAEVVQRLLGAPR